MSYKCIYLYIINVSTYVYICMYVYVYVYISIIWSSLAIESWLSYRELAWVELEPTTIEFRSDALTNWAVRP